MSKELLDTAVTVAAKAGKTKTARALVDLMLLRGFKVRPRVFFSGAAAAGAAGSGGGGDVLCFPRWIRLTCLFLKGG